MNNHANLMQCCEPVSVNRLLTGMKYSVGLPVSNGHHRVNCVHVQIV